MTSAYTISMTHLTIIHTSPDGQKNDINASGEPCTTTDELRSYIGELLSERCIDEQTSSALIAELDLEIECAAC